MVLTANASLTAPDADAGAGVAGGAAGSAGADGAAVARSVSSADVGGGGGRGWARRAASLDPGALLARPSVVDGWTDPAALDARAQQLWQRARWAPEGARRARQALALLSDATDGDPPVTRFLKASPRVWIERGGSAFHGLHGLGGSLLQRVLCELCDASIGRYVSPRDYVDLLNRFVAAHGAIREKL